MLVKELKELLADVPDDMKVFVPVEGGIPAMFAFEEACPSISGVIQFGPPPVAFAPMEKNAPKEGFLIAPHSFHNEEEHENEVKPISN
jgi:hypothetical protein